MGSSQIEIVHTVYITVREVDMDQGRNPFFSRIFERDGRLDMGRRLLKSLGSDPGFLRIGMTAADLRNN